MRKTLDAQEVGLAFSQSELELIDATVGDLCRRCSPAHVADQLRTVYGVDGHTVTIFEERPDWMNPSTQPWMRTSVARFRFFRSRGEWQLYWMPSDLKWHEYEPTESVTDLAGLVTAVDQDALCAFFG